VSEFQTVLPLAELPEGKGVAVEIDGVSVLLCQTAGKILAVENRCSHQDKPLADGRIRNGYIFCPVHGMRFKLETGEPIGQLTRTPLRCFEVRVMDDNIQIRDSVEET